MRKMKDSGIEWIGEIPVEWNMKKIKHTCDLFGRIGFRGYTVDDLVSEQEGAITLSPTNMDGIRLDFSNCSYLSWNKYYESPEIMVNNGDVLLVKTASVGKCVYVDFLPKETTVNPQILVLKNHKENAKFIAYIFQTPVGTSYIDVTKGGSTIFTISQEKIGNYILPFPSIENQGKIVSYLDRKCSEIDTIVRDTEKTIEEYKKLKQSLITEVVTGKKRVAEDGLSLSNQPRKMKDSGVEWVKQIPEEWDSVTPKSLFTQRKDKAIKGEKQLTSSQQYGIVYQDEYMELTGAKIVTAIKDFDILKHVESGDFVISMRSFQGGLEYSTKTGSISSAYVMLIPNLKYVFPRYFRWLFKSQCYIKALQSTSNMVRDGQAMRYSNFSQIYLFNVPLKEQEKIADYLDLKCSQIDKLISEKQTLLQEMESYKKSLIYECVTGKREIN